MRQRQPPISPGAQDAPAIRFAGVRCTYATDSGPVHALDGIALDVRRGEILCLVGSSGSGKTTALRLINRLQEPSAGRVCVDREDVADWDVIRLRRSIGYVIQGAGLFPHLNVRQNVGLLCDLEHWTPAARDERVDELLRRVQLSPESFGARYPCQLSSGQQQRVAVARALALRPPILLLDEPFGALDPLTRAHLQDQFLELQRAEACSVVFVSHDMREAFRLGTRIAVLAEGRLQRLGTPDELRRDPGSPFVERLLEELRLGE